jgi:hypothetical protein
MENVKAMHMKEKKRAKAIEDFRKERNSWIYILKKCCRLNARKLHPQNFKGLFKKKELDIKIRQALENH